MINQQDNMAKQHDISYLKIKYQQTFDMENTHHLTRNIKTEWYHLNKMTNMIVHLQLDG